MSRNSFEFLSISNSSNELTYHQEVESVGEVVKVVTHEEKERRAMGYSFIPVRGDLTISKGDNIIGEFPDTLLFYASGGGLSIDNSINQIRRDSEKKRPNQTQYVSGHPHPQGHRINTRKSWRETIYLFDIPKGDVRCVLAEDAKVLPDSVNSESYRSIHGNGPYYETVGLTKSILKEN